MRGRGTKKKKKKGGGVPLTEGEKVCSEIGSSGNLEEEKRLLKEKRRGVKKNPKNLTGGHDLKGDGVGNPGRSSITRKRRQISR